MDTVFGSVPVFLATCVLLAAAEAVYVLLGFGAGLIAVGTLALLIPEIRDVVVMLLLVNLPAEVFVVWTSRREIVWRGVLALFVGVMAGIPLGTLALDRGDPSLLLLVLGALLVGAGTLFLVFPARRPRRLPRWLTLPVGLLSGVLTGLFGTGGPPLVLYHQFSSVDKAIFRGNLMAIFLLMTVVRVPSYAAVGLITPPRLLSAAAVLPAVVLGAWLGHRIHLRIDEPTFRRLVSTALVVIGVLLLTRLG